MRLPSECSKLNFRHDIIPIIEIGRNAKSSSLASPRQRRLSENVHSPQQVSAEVRESGYLGKSTSVRSTKGALLYLYTFFPPDHDQRMICQTTSPHERRNKLKPPSKTQTLWQDRPKIIARSHTRRWTIASGCAHRSLSPH